MCMEDIKIGRNLDAECRTIVLPANTLVQILGPNTNRVRITLGSGLGNPFRFGPQTITVSATSGLIQGNSFPPYLITVEDVGNMLQQAWFAFSPGVQQEISLIESSLSAKNSGELR